MNKYITAPLNYDGLVFEIKTSKWGWRVTAVFSSGNKLSLKAGTAMEANGWITDIATAYTEGRREGKP